jgi:hypothetical protein
MSAAAAAATGARSPSTWAGPAGRVGHLRGQGDQNQPGEDQVAARWPDRHPESFVLPQAVQAVPPRGAPPA